VVADRDAKSISTETTFARDIGDRDTLRAWLLDLTDQLASRLRRHNLRARCMELKARSSDFRTMVRSQTLPEPTNHTDALWQAASSLFERSLPEELLPLRLLGVGASRLTREPVVQGDLFDGGLRRRRDALDRAVDAIRARFGGGAIRRGGLVNGREAGQEEGGEG